MAIARVFPSVLLGGLLAASVAVDGRAQAEWRPVQKVETYAIEGDSGLALYRSIGERGPKIGIGRAIALTTFRLTWQRDYQRRGTACILASARPTLTITTHLPKPKTALAPDLSARWQRFIAGVTAHEKVHGAQIEAMTRAIEKATVGLSVDNDPDCRKIRADMQPILGGLSNTQRQQSRDFDTAELGKGGNVERLVLDLVNGDRAAPPSMPTPPGPQPPSLSAPRF